MEASLAWYSNAKICPGKLGDHALDIHALDAIGHRLKEHAPRLFTEETEAKLDFLDLGNNAEDFWPSCIGSVQRLREHLGVFPSPSRHGHRCRFLFLHAAHSRDRLKISQEMLMLSFSHLQVVPEFVDFLFPFGFQEHAEDFYFSGFRHKTRLHERLPNKAPTARSVVGDYQICWNLKSVEPSDSEEWSIRHCAVHHSFHMKQVQTSWVVVKGDELMKRRIESATGDQGHLDKSDFKSMDRAFEASLEIHLMFCGWSAENWRWYINYLEDKFQKMTRRAFSAPVRVPKIPATDTEQFSPKPRTNTGGTERSKFSMFSWTQTQSMEKSSPIAVKKQQLPSPQTFMSQGTAVSQPLPPDDDDDDDDDDKDLEVPLASTDINIDDENRDFSFGKLRKVHQIAEKVNEAILVLKQNINVLAQMRQYYRSLTRRKGFPQDLVDSCKSAIDGFGFTLEGLESDMNSQILRLETLRRLLEDRKTLLQNVLEYQNTQANKHSKKSIYTMTEDMNDIARKTKIETVSMKVITLVTLFFLPGTFTSVGHHFLATLMSTNIFQPNDSDNSKSEGPNPYAHLNPLQIYLVLSLPLTVVTLLFWAAFHFWEMRHEQRKKKQHQATGWQV